MKKLLTFIFFVFSLHAKGQNSPSDSSLEDEILVKCDSLNMKTFNKKLKQNLKLMKNRYKFNIEQMIIAVKLYNTVTKSNVMDKNNKNHNEFQDVFNREYHKEAFNMLECTFAKGLTSYSPKYKLYMGGMYTNCYSSYFIYE